jgi:single-strand DNA-binding protein
MNSFTLTAVGNLAQDPVLASRTDGSTARFRLLGDDYAGRDEHGAPREVVTGVWFVAFDAVAETIAANARKGDQLILHAQIRSNDWTDKLGEKHYDHSFIVKSFRFGAPGRASRAQFAELRDAADADALHPLT